MKRIVPTALAGALLLVMGGPLVVGGMLVLGGPFVAAAEAGTYPMVRTGSTASLPHVGTASSVRGATGTSTVPAAVLARESGLTLGKHYLEVSPGIWVPVNGERERRNVRYARLVAFWSDDQRDVAVDEGFPHHRWRDLYDGHYTETWFYPDVNRQYVFDVESGGLIKTTRR
ncbi:MAG TPA: hypothetical protein VF720_03900 [Candidatus Eisenbacteria bacterium]